MSLARQFFFFKLIYGVGGPTLGRGPGGWTGNKDAGVAFFEVSVTQGRGRRLALFPGS